MAELEEGYNLSPTNNSQKGPGYYVEARCLSDDAVTLGDQTIGSKWKRVYFKEGSTGVPGSDFTEPHFKLLGLVNYRTAQALRWWLLAEAGFVGNLNLETRIVKCRTEMSCSATPESFHDVIGPEDRSSIIPDWNTESAT